MCVCSYVCVAILWQNKLGMRSHGAGDFACHHLLVCHAEEDSNHVQLLSALDIARGLLATSSVDVCKEAIESCILPRFFWFPIGAKPLPKSDKSAPVWATATLANSYNVHITPNANHNLEERNEHIRAWDRRVSGRKNKRQHKSIALNDPWWASADLFTFAQVHEGS